MSFAGDPNNFYMPPHQQHTPVFFKTQQSPQEYAFIHIPKNAGSTLRHSVFRFNPHEDFEGDYTSHYTVEQVIKKYGEDRWRNAFTFAFLRDPYDRFLSWVRYLRRVDTEHMFGRTNRELLDIAQKNTPEEIFERLVKDAKEAPKAGVNLAMNKHLWPQHKFITYKGEIVMSYLGLTEKFYECVNHVLGVMNFPPLPEGQTVIGHNVTNKRWLREYTAEDHPLRERVYNLYEEDKTLYDTLVEEFSKYTGNALVEASEKQPDS